MPSVAQYSSRSEYLDGMKSQERREWPLWAQSLGLIVLGWAMTLGTIYAMAYLGDLHRLEAFIVSGPVLTIMAIYWAVKELRARRTGTASPPPVD
jgi:hypothetical protein